MLILRDSLWKTSDVESRLERHRSFHCSLCRQTSGAPLGSHAVDSSSGGHFRAVDHVRRRETPASDVIFCGVRSIKGSTVAPLQVTFDLYGAGGHQLPSPLNIPAALNLPDWDDE